jgi:hypothetical protein
VEQYLLECKNEECDSNDPVHILENGKAKYQVLINGEIRVPADDDCPFCFETMEKTE